MTYKQLFLELKQINNNTYSDEIIYEYLYDDIVFDKLSFISNCHQTKINAQQIIDKFSLMINNNIPWERQLKYTYFLNLKFKLFDNVFSPRKDTEILVQTFLDHFKNQKNQTIIELGSGTGCIPVSIYKNIDNSNKIITIEKQPDSYYNCCENTKFHNCNIVCINDDYLELIKNNKLMQCDYIICNPPYINENFELEKKVLDYDPITALVSFGDELKHYKVIIDYFVSNEYIKGLYFEIGFNQKKMLLDYLNKYANYKFNYRFIKDLNNLDRVLILIK